jgi:hypothetical protein
MDTLLKRKILISSDMEEYFADEASFAVETYLDTEDLASHIEKLKFDDVVYISYDEDSIKLSFTQPEPILNEYD